MERNYLFLNLFFAHDYNINEPINWATPSPFMFNTFHFPSEAI